MTEMAERKPIQIGVDLRPIPMALSDGETWMFHPDPGKSFFAEVSKIGKAMQAGDESEVDWEVIDNMRDSLISQLVDGREDDFREKNYGLTVLGALAAAYAEEVVALPTQPSSGSGPAQKKSGARR